MQKSENIFESAPEDDAPASGLTYLPNARNTSYSFYRAIGKFLCKSLIDSKVVPCSFSSAIYKFLLDIEISLEDLFDYDETMATSLQNLLELPNIDELELEFEVPGQPSVPVTSQNRHMYVRRQVHDFLIERRRPQLEAIKVRFPMRCFYLQLIRCSEGLFHA